MAVVMTPELFFYDRALGGKCHLWLSHYNFEKYVTFFVYHEEHCSLIICVTKKKKKPTKNINNLSQLVLCQLDRN